MFTQLLRCSGFHRRVLSVAAACLAWLLFAGFSSLAQDWTKYDNKICVPNSTYACSTCDSTKNTYQCITGPIGQDNSFGTCEPDMMFTCWSTPFSCGTFTYNSRCLLPSSHRRRVPCNRPPFARSCNPPANPTDAWLGFAIDPCVGEYERDRSLDTTKTLARSDSSAGLRLNSSVSGPNRLSATLLKGGQNRPYRAAKDLVCPALRVRPTNSLWDTR